MLNVHQKPFDALRRAGQKHWGGSPKSVIIRKVETAAAEYIFATALR
jgi:hypothetical protein